SNRIFGVFSRESSELKGMTHDAAGAPVEPLSIVTDDVKDASKETVTEQQNWLKDKYPRVWDFLKAVNVIRSESDFYGLEDQLMKLFQVQALAEMERPLSGLKGSFQ